MRGRHNKIPKVAHIQLTVSTWNKDSHGLFDYQASPDSYKKETFYLEHECKIYRNNISKYSVKKDDKTFIKTSNEMKTRQDFNVQVTSILVNRQNPNVLFQMVPVKHQKMEHLQYDNTDDALTPYIVINNDFSMDSTQGYPLKPGNIIKLGRIEYMVIELKNNQEVQTFRDTKHFQETNGTLEVTKKENSPQHICKICCCDEQIGDNILISPCNCKGSCQMIHVGCLKTWINTKVKKQLHSNLTTSYNFTKFQCEICKFPFPKFVKVDNNLIEMMTISKPDRPYVILESLKTKTQVREEKYLHLISIEENSSVKIGRGHNSQIRVTDISVSRNHAQIIFQNNRFYLKDLSSKFGTLVRFSEDMQIKGQIKLQFGRSLFQFKMQKEPHQVDTQ